MSQSITTRGKSNVINIGMSEKKNYSLKILNINYIFKLLYNQKRYNFKISS